MNSFYKAHLYFNNTVARIDYSDYLLIETILLRNSKINVSRRGDILFYTQKLLNLLNKF